MFVADRWCMYIDSFIFDIDYSYKIHSIHDQCAQFIENLFVNDLIKFSLKLANNKSLCFTLQFQLFSCLLIQ